MRAIDVIKKQIDNDLIKYQQVFICKIIESRFKKGVGLIVKARPYTLEKDMSLQSDMEGIDERDGYVDAICVNRTYGWNDKNISEKYDIVVLSTLKDNPSLCPGFLVPITTVPMGNVWDDKSDDQAKKKQNLEVSTGEK